MTRTNRNRTYLLAGAVLTAALVALMLALFWNYTQDDVFITYAHSRNIAAGNGFVFYPGQSPPVQGSTTPLWALIMAGVHLVTADVLHAGNLLSAASLTASLAFLYLLVRRRWAWYIIIGAWLLIVTSPLAVNASPFSSLTPRTPVTAP